MDKLITPVDMINTPWKVSTKHMKLTKNGGLGRCFSLSINYISDYFSASMEKKSGAYPTNSCVYTSIPVFISPSQAASPHPLKVSSYLWET